MSGKVKLIESMSTFQGEGPDVGKAMTILRFKQCNLDCVWCDTKVKMRISIEGEYDIDNIQELINKNHSGILVTGGEPTYGTNFAQTIMLLNELDYPVANVETNGHNLEKLISKCIPRNLDVKFIYSPKIFNSEDLDLAINKSGRLFNEQKVYFKVVIDNSQLHLINRYLEYLSNEKVHQKVYLMPEGTTRKKLIENSGYVFDLCEEYRFNFSTRSHIMFGFI